VIFCMEIEHKYTYTFRMNHFLNVAVFESYSIRTYFTRLVIVFVIQVHVHFICLPEMVY
jgi:hypothetical protein